MNTDKHRSEMEDKINQITERIIGAAFAVSNTLGAGFLEKVYENAMMVECSKIGLDAKQQQPIQVFYHDNVVGEYFADLFVENQIVVEFKAVKAIDDVHLAQLLNYLKACKLRYSLLINFGKPKVEIKRVVNGF